MNDVNVFTAVLKRQLEEMDRLRVLLFILCTFPLWTDEEYVTGYGVQVLGLFDDDVFDCFGATGSPRAIGSITFQNKVGPVFCYIP